MKELIYKKV